MSFRVQRAGWSDDSLWMRTVVELFATGVRSARDHHSVQNNGKKTCSMTDRCWLNLEHFVARATRAHPSYRTFLPFLGKKTQQKS
jgi:hypothetical protein